MRRGIFMPGLKYKAKPRIVSVNGYFVPENQAMVSIFDRGFLFGDGVYEVTSVIDGKLIDWHGHVARLDRSLKELEIPHPSSAEELLETHRELIRLNKVTQGLVYLQVTRGSADRDFVYPEKVEPTLVLFTQKKGDLVDNPLVKKGIRVITTDDIRWGRRDIKTVQLLAASMAKMEAKAAGVDDAWMVEDGYVTEGTSNNAYIVTQDQTLVTRQLSNDILHGITRAAVLRLANERNLTIEERPFSVAEAQGAVEAFSTSATNFVMPVVEIDGVAVGEGVPGPIAADLRDFYIQDSIASAV
jgi:D-alanine transaminase